MVSTSPEQCGPGLTAPHTAQDFLWVPVSTLGLDQGGLLSFQHPGYIFCFGFCSGTPALPSYHAFGSQPWPFRGERRESTFNWHITYITESHTSIQLNEFSQSEPTIPVTSTQIKKQRVTRTLKAPAGPPFLFPSRVTTILTSTPD